MWSGLAVVTLLAAVAGVGIWWFFRDDAPDEVSLDAAVASLGGSEATDATAADATPEPAGPPADGTVTEPRPADPSGDDAEISGVWTVDTSIGEFSYEDSTGTFVGFRVREELSGIGSTTAVGRTPEVSGTLEIDGTTVTAVSIEADMRSITTNDSRRDNRVQGALGTGEFPTATFVLREPIDLGDSAVTGAPVSVEAVGDLTVKGVTRPVVVPLDAQLVDGTIVTVGSLHIVFEDYGVSVPSAPIVLSADDEGVMELQLFFTR